MNRILLMSLVAALALAFSGVGPSVRASDDHGACTIYIVRHAETTDDPGDRPLSALGAARAERLAAMLADEDVGAVLSTRTRRTVQTATPVADAHGVEIAHYEPKDYAALVERVHRECSGRAVVIVGHSNTVGHITEAFGGPAIGDLDESVYERLFVVVGSPGGPTETLLLRY